MYSLFVFQSIDLLASTKKNKALMDAPVLFEVK